MVDVVNQQDLITTPESLYCYLSPISNIFQKRFCQDSATSGTGDNNLLRHYQKVILFLGKGEGNDSKLVKSGPTTPILLTCWNDLQDNEIDL